MKLLAISCIAAALAIGCGPPTSEAPPVPEPPDIAELIIRAGSGDEDASRALQKLTRQNPALFSPTKKVPSFRGPGFAEFHAPGKYRFHLASQTAKILKEPLWWDRWKGKRLADVAGIASGWDGVSADLSDKTLTYELLIDSPPGLAYFTVRNGIVVDIRIDIDVEALPGPDPL